MNNPILINEYTKLKIENEKLSKETTELRFKFEALRDDYNNMLTLVSFLREEDVKDNQIIIKIKKAKTVRDWEFKDIFGLIISQYRR